MQILASALISSAIVFVIYAFRGAPFVSRFISFVPEDFYIISSLPILYAIVNILIHVAQGKRVSRGRWTFFVTAATISAFAAAASFVYSVTISNPPQNNSQIIIYAGLFAAFFATVGWIATNYLNFVNARKAHTMNILMQMRTTSIFNDHMLNISKHFDINTPLSKETAIEIRKEAQNFHKWDDKSKWPVYKSIVYVANYFEFMCLGMNSGDLDKKMMKKSMHSIIRNYYKFSKSVIEISRKDDFGAPNDRIFCEFMAVAKEYGVDT